jgi:hypothetical protein
LLIHPGKMGAYGADTSAVDTTSVMAERSIERARLSNANCS